MGGQLNVDQLTFTDLIQKSFIAMSMGTTDRITTLNIIANISMSFLVGMFIFYIYKKTFQGVLYQKSFNISLVLAGTVTTVVIMTISGNLILSLGMVGALSIVRFRTPVKDSMDLVFLFWAISSGIANGVGYYNISVVGSIMIAIFLLILTRSKGGSIDSFLLVLEIPSSSNEQEIIGHIEKHSQALAIKSKIINDSGSELVLEVKSIDNNTSYVDMLQQEGKVSRATIVAYDQDMSAA